MRRTFPRVRSESPERVLMRIDVDSNLILKDEIIDSEMILTSLPVSIKKRKLRLRKEIGKTGFEPCIKEGFAIGGDPVTRVPQVRFLNCSALINAKTFHTTSKP